MASAVSSRHFPVEPKTQAAGLAGTVAGVAVYLLQTYAFKGHAVPAGLISLIYAAVPGVVAFVAAYLAPHQVRPSDPVPAPSVLPPNLPPTPASNPGGTA